MRTRDGFPDTQLESWDSLQEDIGKRQAEVLTAIKRKPQTLFELCDCLNNPVNHISGRVTELRHKGLIRDCGKRKINPQTGKRGIVWEYTDAREEA